jgi:serine-type D-Ala-D-Ala carboxypeptidase (penicillin-binding protein 5/6)
MQTPGPQVAGRRRTHVAAVAGGIVALALVAGFAFLLVAPGAPLVGKTARPLIQPTAAARPPAQAPAVQAWSGILMDRRTGAVLWAKDAGRRLQPASCTKIMTALLTLERTRDLSAYIRVPADVRTVSRWNCVGLQPGQHITVYEALRATLVKSANDAAVTLAVYVGGSERRFIALMNARARGLGLTHTHFVNPTGIPAPGHLSSARDLADLARYAMSDARFRPLVDIRSATIHWPPDHAVVVRNHNRLLAYSWADGIKTGATRRSGAVLVASGQMGSVPFIYVSMHQPTRDQEVKDAVAMFSWGTGQYATIPLTRTGDIVTSRPVAGGGRVALLAAGPVSAVVRRGATVTRRFALPAAFPRSPSEGTTVGAVTYASDGLTLGTVELVSSGDPVSPLTP